MVSFVRRRVNQVIHSFFYSGWSEIILLEFFQKKNVKRVKLKSESLGTKNRNVEKRNVIRYKILIKWKTQSCLIYEINFIILSIFNFKKLLDLKDNKSKREMLTIKES